MILILSGIAILITGEFLGHYAKKLLVKTLCEILAMALFIIPITVGMSAIPVEQTWVVRTKSIISLQDNSLIEGKFRSNFLFGYGYIQEHPAYFFYSANDNGSYSLDWVYNTNTEIFQDQTDNTGFIAMRYHTRSQESPWGYWSCAQGTQSLTTITEIHVPKNTIQIDFNLDSKR